ncbi:hypothetical protein [Collinsella sp. An2]|uniref:hypothetical protein n=1 Tax=Collinsella sp. An2 TaxID=1965585 RepID=UPI000B3769B4|nr:hypothetical protein [Collinsella sp. An2]OUP10983.1 hypothetical protein B5F33_00950 [Collinsella sp. An2]
MAECRFHGECRLCGGLAPRECDGRGMVTTLSAVGYVYDRCSRFEPMPDRDALLKIADECIGFGLNEHCARSVLKGVGHDIRKALGVKA